MKNAIMFVSLVAIVLSGYLRVQNDIELKLHSLRTELSAQNQELRRELKRNKQERRRMDEHILDALDGKQDK
jgi:predicted Holliday junction resolvase-like endonuclease